MGFVLSTIRFLTCKPSTAESRRLTVEVEQGILRGTESKAAYTGKKFYSFLGIPFAKPPLGNLRFRPPEPPEPWKGVYDATYERSGCRQRDPLLLVKLGSENCLYLNVYTPKLPSEITKPLPVMVFIHGGGFVFGSYSKKLYGADFFMNHEVILVAINYRLHVLGFLNLGISDCPGNVGMKDQVQALKWIQNNILKFGGDPDNVTIFGESAGASSVAYHAVSPLSQGLFHKAIMQSGMKTSPWAYTSNPIEMAFRFARKAGFYGTDRLKLLQYLRSIPVNDLVTYMEEVYDDLQTRYFTRGTFHFSPSTELITEGAFLPDHPQELMKFSKPIPTIIGYNESDGIIILILKFHLMKKLRHNFPAVIKDNFIVNSELVPDLADKIKKLYFGNKRVDSATGNEFVEMFTDISFYHFYDEIEPLLKSNFPPYVYRFSYVGRINLYKLYIIFYHLKMHIRSRFRGAAHGDELNYLFYSNMLIYPRLSNKDKAVINHMTTMWTNFATTGNPSTEKVEWTSCSAQNLCYLDITEKPEMKSGKIYGERIEKLHSILDPVAERRV